MKNAEVIKPFRDKFTKEVRNVGDIVAYEDDRYKELKEKGFVKYSRKKAK